MQGGKNPTVRPHGEHDMLTLLTDKVTEAELKVTDWSHSKHNQILLLSIVALYLIKASLHFMRQH